MVPVGESSSAVEISRQSVADPAAMSFTRLLSVSGPKAPPTIACLRIPEQDLVICDGSGLALYSLRVSAHTAGWEQRTISYPPVGELRALGERPDWARRARWLCATAAQARVCRVTVGVVAAEARAAEDLADLADGEEAVLRLSEAASALLQAAEKEAAKAGRALMADIERARRPSHVPLHLLRGALAEELALGRSATAICSRSPGFSDSTDDGKVTSLLCRRLGLLGSRDSHRRLRYSRVASVDAALLLCEALEVAPEQVGL